ncbi:hypothetical protein HHI36_001784 [Cryptolaemus montrouzieri]|uniref:Uncharacterized protein n=1 Tax=Cryptolaemus montrouzieri TaxID=559131 RepID=A0ABD2P8N6_9CUCU
MDRRDRILTNKELELELQKKKWKEKTILWMDQIRIWRMTGRENSRMTASLLYAMLPHYPEEGTRKHLIEVMTSYAMILQLVGDGSSFDDNIPIARLPAARTRKRYTIKPKSIERKKWS